MTGLDTAVLRSLTRPFRVAIYKLSAEFESAVRAELAALRLAAPNAPAELLKMKMLRPGVRATKRAVWREAAKRLALTPDAAAQSTAKIFATPRAAALPGGRVSLTSAKSRRSRIEATPRPPTEPIDLAGVRADFRAIALGGENRVLISTPGGPDSLTEALQLFARAGLLSVNLEPEANGDPTLVYRPLPRAPEMVPEIAPEPRSFSGGASGED